MSISIITLIDTTTDATGIAFELDDAGRRTLDVIQSGTGTWHIEVSNDRDALTDPASVTWRTLKTGTSGDGYEVDAPWKYIRARTTGMSSANIKILLGIVPR